MALASETHHGPRDQADQNFDHMFKILIIGNSSVGKTSFLFRYADDSFTPAFVSTVGIDFKVKTIYRNDKRIKLQIWVRWEWSISVGPMYAELKEMSTQIKTYSWENAQVLLVGNKCDLEDDRVVTADRGGELAQQLGLGFMEASAKLNVNVKQVFEYLVDLICESMKENPDSLSNSGVTDAADLSRQPQRSNKECAC
ncbi:RAB3A, member RAS oncogene family, a [Trichomycterus rosablanca]|uniref:RAB3A, member RAS oncogene family, a n=1 Tax=Trichomycterus rosablanca TaxID=2290929 RepID=UPI002F354904